MTTIRHSNVDMFSILMKNMIDAPVNYSKERDKPIVPIHYLETMAKMPLITNKELAYKTGKKIAIVREVTKRLFDNGMIENTKESIKGIEAVYKLTPYGRNYIKEYVQEMSEWET